MRLRRDIYNAAFVSPNITALSIGIATECGRHIEVKGEQRKPIFQAQLKNADISPALSAKSGKLFSYKVEKMAKTNPMAENMLILSIEFSREFYRYRQY